MKTARWITVMLMGAFFIMPFAVSAGEGLTLSVTPPLIQISMNPGDQWQSAIKAVNPNPYALTVYATVMDFAPTDDEGHGAFVPASGDPEHAQFSLARWMTITKEPVTIPSEGSVAIPFSIRASPDAEPGGHYATILIGTEPPAPSVGGTIRVSTMISALVFARISGNVREEGYIREFSTDRGWYQSSALSLTLRFENTGSVHLKPQGDIVISNMWGKERGRIIVNQDSEFGNVLPQSDRKFVFEWQGEGSIFDMGRYTALATLAYGKEARRTVTRSVAFWVVPMKPLFAIVGILGAGAIIVALGIRAYVYHAMTTLGFHASKPRRRRRDGSLRRHRHPP